MHWKLLQDRNFMPQQRTRLGQAATIACSLFIEEETKLEGGARQSNTYSLHLSCYPILFQGPWRILLSETTWDIAVRGWAPRPPPHKVSVFWGCNDQQTPHANLERRYYFHKKHSYYHLGNLVLAIQNSGAKFNSNILFL